jgi:uncharacterized membrane protein
MLAVAWLPLLVGCDDTDREPLGRCVTEAPPGGDLESCSAVLLPQLDRREGSPDYLICTSARALSASGVITGETCDDQGFVWTAANPAGSLVLPSLPVPAHAVTSAGINAAGDIVGWFLAAGATAGEAFLLSAGELTRLPGIEEGFPASALGINDGGTIVGEGQTGPGQESPTAAVYWQDGQIHRIEGVDELGGTAASAVAVSQNDTIVGASNTSDLVAIQPFRWRRPDPVELLPTLDEGHVGAPQDVNEAGVTVGRDGGPLPDAINEAVYWDEDGNIHQLPGLYGTPDINALAINNRGVIVGYEMTPEFIATEARVWLDGEVHDLEDLISLPPEYRLTRAVDINDDDEVVAIAAVEDGGPIRRVTFLLRPDL